MTVTDLRASLTARSLELPPSPQTLRVSHLTPIARLFRAFAFQPRRPPFSALARRLIIISSLSFQHLLRQIHSRKFSLRSLQHRRHFFSRAMSTMDGLVSKSPIGLFRHIAPEHLDDLHMEAQIASHIRFYFSSLHTTVSSSFRGSSLVPAQA
ncbi:hypothetical protein B0H16DRAFT_594199 [Mycena metata]|uniref:Uncharacterized protein n=1 Tax=Mycena metata TaxID=1033252 RepID=A0AAD7J985_9AGAR|nr:hypothetical protein B0H16DRAFT_594199 [Mycena metata]